MSAKSSPGKKDDKVTSAPTKKDDKASSSSSSATIMTRNQSAFLNTRQLRNKASSRKKISEITQLLLSPTRERSAKTSQIKKKSPKDKTKASPKKQTQTISVNKLILEVKKEKKSVKKRKNVSEPKGMKPAKLRRESPHLTSQELIDLCEEQSLNDEDFYEILTCESPVWWEDPEDQLYCEDAIFTSPEGKRYLKEMHKSQNQTEEMQTEEEHIVPDMRHITIPEVKQNDDRFMKKRSNIENLLGNIKNKLSDGNKDEIQSIQKKMDDKTHEPENLQEIKNTEVKATKDEQNKIQSNEFKKDRLKKTPSESTSSSDEMFFGFQNEEILKDLENMDIPIKKEVADKEDTVTDADNPNITETENNSKDNLEEDVKNSTGNNNMKDIKSDDNMDTEKDDILKSEPVTNNTAENTDLKTKNDTNSFLEVSKHVSLESNQKSPCEDTDGGARKPKNTVDSDNKDTSSDKSIVNLSKHNEIKNADGTNKNSKADNETTATHTPFDSVKIYYIDASTKSSEKLTDSKTKNEVKNDKSITTSNEKQNISQISNNEVKSNEKPDSTSESNKQCVKDKVIKNVENDAKTDVVNKEDDKINTKDEKEVKPKSSKNLNKNHLMAVYKIITDEEFRENYMKTVKDKVVESSITTNVSNPSNGLETLFKTYKSSFSNNKQTIKKPNNIIEEKNNEIVTKKQENKNSNELEPKERTHNEVITLNNQQPSKEKNLNDNASEVTQLSFNPNNDNNNKIIQTKNEQLNEEKITKANKTESKDITNDKLCASCDTNTERSLNITSKVKSAKYCLKCSSIFESETCSYCAKKSKINQENCLNGTQQTRKGNS